MCVVLCGLLCVFYRLMEVIAEIVSLTFNVDWIKINGDWKLNLFYNFIQCGITRVYISSCFRIACLRTNATHAVAISQRIFAVCVCRGRWFPFDCILFYRLINIAFDSELNWEIMYPKSNRKHIIWIKNYFSFPHLKHNKSERYSWSRCSVISTASSKKI